MSVFHHKTQFTSVQLACAIVGVTDLKEKENEVLLWQQEIDLAFPPEYREESVQAYPGTTPYKNKWIKYPAISREQALAFCEQRGIRPPLLFPADSDKVSNKEAFTVYTLLAAALVQHYGCDALRDRKVFLSKWVEDLSKKGIVLPIKDPRTLEKAIDKAALKVDSLYHE